jgi:hypothetical protein
MTTAATIHYEGKPETFHVEYTVNLMDIEIDLVTLRGERVTLSYLNEVEIKREISKKLSLEDLAKIHLCRFTAKNTGFA